MKYIKRKFAVIEDNRHPSYVEQNSADVLTIIMCAVLSGLDGLADIVTYVENKAEFFKKKFWIGLIPSKPTFSVI